MISADSSGVDLSKIFGRQTKLLGEKVIKNDKYTGVSQLLRGHVPGLPPPKSTIMAEAQSMFGNIGCFVAIIDKGLMVTRFRRSRHAAYL